VEACSQGGVEMFRVPAAVAPDVIYLLGDACRGALATFLMVLALREKSQAPGSRMGDGGDYIAPSWRNRLGELASSGWRVFLLST
jgi:hypothetical protein